MAIANELECTGSYQEVLARLHLALTERHELAGDLDTANRAEECDFRIREYQPGNMRLHATARGALRNVANGCTATYRIGNNLVHTLSAVTASVCICVGIAIWSDPATRNPLAFAAGISPVLGGLAFVELSLVVSARRLNRLLIEHLRG